VYILDGVQGNNPEAIKVKRIAFGLAEPLGLKVVDNEIYVMQKHELTKLVDLDNDEIIDEYQTVCNGWTASTNFHEFAFGLVYKDGYFYGTLATAIDPGGASSKPQLPDRGKVIKISKADGSFSFVASGLRTPNGIGIGPDNEIFIADNQGDWLPANKIVHLKQGAWYGSRSVDFKGTEGLAETPPLVYLTQDEISKSPSQPIKLDIGPYKNQLIFGDITHGGIKRAFVEKVNGEYQGAAFRFAQGLEVGVNRLVWGSDGALYVGGVGMKGGGWIQYGKLTYGLQKLTYNKTSVFEMLAVRAKSNGVEIEFTEPLKEGSGTQAADYNITQWWFKPTAEYGGPKMDEHNLAVRSVNLSADRRKVFLELPWMKPKHVVYIRLNHKTVKSKDGDNLWTTEAWYTMNNIPMESGKVEAKR
jgi:cytochrome c